MLIERLLKRGYTLYERSVQEIKGVTLALLRKNGEKHLFLSQAFSGFSGEAFAEGGMLCPLSFANARALAQVFTWLTPQRLPKEMSFGFGDRLGLATPGHIRGLVGAKVFPVLAQQSVRENIRTGRTFEDVLAQAIFGAFQEGYKGGFGADADHLKRTEDAVDAANLGYTFFTCDPGDHIVAAEKMSATQIRERFARLPEAKEYRRQYLNRTFAIEGISPLHFSEKQLLHVAVKYDAAIRHAVKLYCALTEMLNSGFDYEVSVDETKTPTTPLEHFFVALELHRFGVDFVSMAPRFSGTMEKGVDWRGDRTALQTELHAHAAIAKALGRYRLSLHSGSDKFSLYQLFAEETDGLCHIKTAGISYLVALEVLTRRAPDLFREIVRFSTIRFSEDQASYHISANPARIPALETLSDDKLSELLTQHDSRQMLHVSYGSVLQSPLGDELRLVLNRYEEDHYEALSRHLSQHLDLLRER